uniref:Uncharacterized protein n=1 Tax=Avena sativa TaxID=4498 RepID=A0ACD5X394_AVESA
MAARHRRPHMDGPKPTTWLVTIKAAPPAPARDNTTRKLAAPAHSPPLLLSPSVWQRAQDGKKGRAGGGREDVGSRVPGSPRIGCMGQVKGARICPRARGPAGSGRGSDSGYAYACGGLGGLLTRLFGRRKGRKSRASHNKVWDVRSDDSSSSGSARGARAAASARPFDFDPPLPVPVVRRPPVEEENGASLWERRRGGGKALEGLQLT